MIMGCLGEVVSRILALCLTMMPIASGAVQDSAETAVTEGSAISSVDVGSDGGTAAIPENPSFALPDGIDSSIPGDATMISRTLARLSDGTVRNVETGRVVTDASVVGTPTTPPDPLAVTHGIRFIPVSVAEVRKVMHASSKSSSSESSRVTTIALQDGEYGAHWGTYNGSSAFFNADGTLFVQQAKEVIDVAEWQGAIDWKKVKAAGVQGPGGHHPDRIRLGQRIRCEGRAEHHLV